MRIYPNHPDARTARIYLDGILLNGLLVSADEELGEVIRILLDRKGHCYLDESGNDVAKEILRGNVVIKTGQYK